MWSPSIEVLNPYEATLEAIERERRLAAIPVLHRSNWIARLLRRIKIRV